MNTQECPDITKKNKVRLSRTVEYEGNSIVRNSPIKISDKCDKSLVNMGTLKRDSDAHSEDTSSVSVSNSQRQSLSGNKMTANKRLSQRSLRSFLISKPAQSSHNGVKLSPNPDSLPKFPPKFRTKKIIKGNHKSSNHGHRKITQFTTPIILSKSETQDNLSSEGTPPPEPKDGSFCDSQLNREHNTCLKRLKEF